MNVTFRADASIDIGIGHVMRCLTLGEMLKSSSARCRFVCRPHKGNLISQILDRGFEVLVLPQQTDMGPQVPGSIYDGWLGANWREDAEQTAGLLAEQGVDDWLVVDHYGIDHSWESVVSPYFRRLMVIDDLANRRHKSHLLLDQTYGRQAREYEGLVGPECELLCGVEHVLLRSEFAEWQQRSVERRRTCSLRRILISMGGVDRDGLSCRVFHALCGAGLPPGSEIKVVLGNGSPWIGAMRAAVNSSSLRAELIVAANNMAELLAWSDLAIGAAGTSSWERCYMAVPTALFILADNQREIAARLSELGAVLPISSDDRLEDNLISGIAQFLSEPHLLREMSEKALQIVPLNGTEYVARKILERLG